MKDFSEPYYNEQTIACFKRHGYAYLHSINECTSVFFSEDTGQYITYDHVQEFLDEIHHKENDERQNLEWCGLTDAQKAQGCLGLTIRDYSAFLSEFQSFEYPTTEQ